MGDSGLQFSPSQASVNREQLLQRLPSLHLNSWLELLWRNSERFQRACAFVIYIYPESGHAQWLKGRRGLINVRHLTSASILSIHWRSPNKESSFCRQRCIVFEDMPLKWDVCVPKWGQREYQARSLQKSLLLYLHMLFTQLHSNILLKATYT